MIKAQNHNKKDLKERTIKLIEQEVEETADKISKDLELHKMEQEKEKRHVKVEEKKTIE